MSDEDVEFRGLYCPDCDEMIAEGKDYAKFISHLWDEHHAPPAKAAVKLEDGTIEVI